MVDHVADSFRKRVPQALGLYLLGAWGLIEFLDWAGDRLGIAGPWADFAMISAVVMLPSVILLSYRWGAERSDRTRHMEWIAVIVNIGAAVGLASLIAYGGSPSALDTNPEGRTRLTETGRASLPSYSPDGQFVAYLDRDPEGVAVRVIPLADGTSREIFRHERAARVSWTLGGDSLDVQTRSGEIHRVALEGGAARVLSGVAPFRSWSPDGRRLASADYPGKILFIQPVPDSTGNEALQLPITWAHQFLRGLSWSPTAPVMAVLTWHENRSQIWAMPLDGSKPYQLADVFGQASSPQWSADGSSLFYSLQGPLLAAVWKIDVDPATGQLRGPRGGEDTRVPIQGTFQISPDGKDLVTTDFSVSDAIWQYRRDGNAPEGFSASQLTIFPGKIGALAIAPDGQSLVFSNPLGPLQLLELGGSGSQRALPTPAQTMTAAWSPSGSQLAFQAPGGGSLIVWTMTLPSGTPRSYEGTTGAGNPMAWCEGGILFQRLGNQNFGVLDPDSGTVRDLLEEEIGWPFNPICGPDGEHVAFFWNRPPSRGLWTLSLRTGEARLLEGGFHSPVAWSGDGEWIYAVDLKIPNRTTWFRVRYPQGGAEIIAELDHGVLTRRTMASSIDGSTLMLGLRDVRTNVWLVEDFEAQQDGQP